MYCTDVLEARLLFLMMKNDSESFILNGVTVD